MTTVALSCRFVRNLAIGSMLLVPVCAAQPAAAQAPPAVQWRVEDGGNGHWYRVDVWTKSIEWTTARIHAAELGGHLVTITTEAEDLWILSLVMNTDGAWEGVRGPWLGAFAEAPCTSGDACFEWITGEPFSYTRWHPGNPDNVSSTDPTGMVNVLLWEPSWTRAWQDVGPENPGLSTGGRSAIIEWSADCNLMRTPTGSLILANLSTAMATVSATPPTTARLFPTLIKRIAMPTESAMPVNQAQISS